MPAPSRCGNPAASAFPLLAASLLLAACAATQLPAPSTMASPGAAARPGGAAPAGPGWSAAMASAYNQLAGSLAGSGATVARTADDRIAVTLPGDLSFESNRSALKPQARGLLDRVSVALRGLPRAELRITGHTDARGGAQANQVLSLDRAESTRDWLVARGIAASRFSVAGRGALEPVAGNDTDAGRAVNRRVEILIGSPKVRTGG